MAEQLQSLLDRIQKEGVDKADAEASRIIEAARQKAEQIVADADAKAKASQKKAEEDAEALVARGRRSLEQAARDVVLSVRGAVGNTLATLVKADVSQALDEKTVSALVTGVVEAYTKDSTGNTRIDVLVPEDLKQQIQTHFMARLSESIRKGIDIKADRGLAAGFRVSFVNERVEHDFSDAAIADALCGLLRPHLAEIVASAAANTEQAQ